MLPGLIWNKHPQKICNVYVYTSPGKELGWLQHQPTEQGTFDRCYIIHVLFHTYMSSSASAKYTAVTPNIILTIIRGKLH